MKANKRLFLAVLGFCVVLVGWYIAIAGEPVKSFDDIDSLARQKKRDVLNGLTGVCVMVENIKTEVENAGLTKQAIQTDVELELRRFGIRVLSDDERRSMPGKPCLYVNVNAHSHSGDNFTGNIEVELIERVILQRKPIECAAVTWSTGLAFGGHAEKQVRDSLKQCVDEFINDYLAANPKDTVESKDANDS